jgi:hypothetical protein
MSTNPTPSYTTRRFAGTITAISKETDCSLAERIFLEQWLRMPASQLKAILNVVEDHQQEQEPEPPAPVFDTFRVTMKVDDGYPRGDESSHDFCNKQSAVQWMLEQHIEYWFDRSLSGRNIDNCDSLTKFRVMSDMRHLLNMLAFEDERKIPDSIKLDPENAHIVVWTMDKV